jgi:hypothetical protein
MTICLAAGAPAGSHQEGYRQEGYRQEQRERSRLHQ